MNKARRAIRKLDAVAKMFSSAEEAYQIVRTEVRDLQDSSDIVSSLIKEKMELSPELLETPSAGKILEKIEAVADDIKILEGVMKKAHKERAVNSNKIATWKRAIVSMHIKLNGFDGNLTSVGQHVAFAASKAKRGAGVKASPSYADGVAMGFKKGVQTTLEHFQELNDMSVSTDSDDTDG